MSAPNNFAGGARVLPIAPGDVVELKSGHRVTVTGVHAGREGESYLDYLDPCPIEDCDCDPYRTSPTSSVRPVMQS